MSRFHPHEDDTAPEDSRQAMEDARAEMGFTPNIYRVMAEAPPTLNGYLALHEFFDNCSFSPAESQLVLLTMSARNGCDYCVAAHSRAAKGAGLAEDVIRAVRDDTPIADPRLAALSAFAAKMVDKRGWVSDHDIDDFLAAGFDKSQVLEVVLGAGLKTISNYTNHIAEVPLDDAFEATRWEMPEGRRDNY